jgi:hypothetical protein
MDSDHAALAELPSSKKFAYPPEIMQNLNDRDYMQNLILNHSHKGTIQMMSRTGAGGMAHRPQSSSASRFTAGAATPGVQEKSQFCAQDDSLSLSLRS